VTGEQAPGWSNGSIERTPLLLCGFLWGVPAGCRLDDLGEMACSTLTPRRFLVVSEGTCGPERRVKSRSICRKGGHGTCSSDCMVRIRNRSAWSIATPLATEQFERVGRIPQRFGVLSGLSFALDYLHATLLGVPSLGRTAAAKASPGSSQLHRRLVFIYFLLPHLHTEPTRHNLPNATSRSARLGTRREAT
jgi:hypothetical protein